MPSQTNSTAEVKQDIYFCLPISDSPVRAALARASRDLPATNPDKYHLTLRYIKQVNQLALDSLILAAGRLCQNHRPLSLTLDQPGNIPRINCYRPANSLPLKQLQADIDRAVCDLGFPPADYDYNPHITLGRQPDRTVWTVEAASWQARQVELRRSETGVTINPLLAEFLLGPAGHKD